MSSNNLDSSKSIFQRGPWITLFALTAALLWGWAYPLIKLGFQEFGITSDMTSSKMLFAGIRFCISGLIILAFAGHKGKSFKTTSGGAWWFILVFSLLNTTFHYAFFYFGLSFSEGSRASILNSISTFLVVILACLFFKSDKMNLQKILGCVVGFAGVLILNAGGGSSEFSWAGDGMIILNAICSAFASLMTRGLSKRVDVFVGTGYSLSIGGALLIIPGVVLGGSLPSVTVQGCGILLGLITISTVAFALYNKLLSVNPVGKIAIYNSLIPVIGVLTSCMCLGEAFQWKYLLAGTLAAAGIYIINRGK